MRTETKQTLAVDAGLALAVVVGCLLLGLAGLPDWYWSALVAVPLAIRRVAPLTMLALVAVISGTHLLVAHSFLFPGDLVGLVAIHAVAAYATDRLRHAGLLLGAAGALVVAGYALHDRRLGAGLPGVLIMATSLAAWSTGLMQRQQRSAVDHAERRRRLAEQDSAMRAQLAVHEERSRISREMHDIIAHSLASIIAQAEGGRVAARADAVVAGPLFDRIAGTGREALADVKRLLTAVDRDDDLDAKGLRELPALLTSVAAAGLRVTVTRDGSEQPLGPGMDLAVYRVIQESLTNVIKHAPRQQAHLRMCWTPEVLTVTVTSPSVGPGGSAPVEGRGVSGIRQRCSLFNGACTLTAGSEFAVTTTWPLVQGGVPQ
ncbi:two-component sensor histidine kinase [Micromonospora sp. C31]|uniref:sensor histidine kinase n=1 Tax=Micromonospora sp. C31 TaxID=2824876 RepID=UPI001B35ED25|nr:histidine kinase [Micromonospora sp. C31]MBQ1075826.1 two-component sensor histidine kinase [Micromonospora sp. C31]